MYMGISMDSFVLQEDWLMDTKINNFLQKKGINSSDIMYFTREGQKTSIHISNSQVIFTYIPIKAFLKFLDDNMFITVNKGIALGVDYISSIEDGIYTMCDGSSFKGRSRTPAQHRDNNNKIARRTSCNKTISERIPELFSVMDNSPIAFAVIEVTFDNDGHGMDFVFRYCNEAMLKLEKLSADDIIDKSFYEVFKDSNRKWMVSYADVALNGSKKIISYYLNNSNRKVLAYCYQPYERFCACSLIEVESIINVAENLI